MNFDILNSLGVAYQCDGQTDGQLNRTAFRAVTPANELLLSPRWVCDRSQFGNWSIFAPHRVRV